MHKVQRQANESITIETGNGCCLWVCGVRAGGHRLEETQGGFRAGGDALDLALSNGVAQVRTRVRT